jgi:hypothetical protein
VRYNVSRNGINLAFTENIMTKLTELLATGKIIFTLDDLSVIWSQNKRSNTSQSAKEYARAGDLVRLRRGLYALSSAKPTVAEIASKLVVPSYLTGETVLKKYGLSFQMDERITSAALVSKKIRLGGALYTYYKFNDDIFYNRRGVIEENGVTMATRERAVADLIYLNGASFAFEDLTDIDWPKLTEIGQIYGKKSVVENIEKLRNRYAKR